MSAWEIYAIKYGDRGGRTRADSCIFDDNHDAPHAMDYFIWVLRRGAEVVLVDTGYDSQEADARNRPIRIDPVTALQPLGLQPEDITQIIVTHLHYDHAGGLHPFSHAKLYVQAADMAYATGPCMCHAHLRAPFTGSHICDMVRALYEDRVAFIEGTREIRPGVEAHWMGGHSRGLQSVRVRTRRGWVMLASDASHFYENFLENRAFPIVVDVEDALNAFGRLRALADSMDHIIPGHDPLVLKRYPLLRPDTPHAVCLSADPLERL